MVPYHPGANYALGATHYKASKIRALATYQVLVECPSGNDFMDMIIKETAYRCDGGSGNNLKPDQSKTFDMVKGWGGWTDAQRERLDPEGFYECEYARDGRSFGCVSYDVMHCVYMTPRKEIPGMQVAVKTNHHTKVTWGKDEYDGPKVNIAVHSSGTIQVEAIASIRWPTHAIVHDGKLYMDEELRAGVYASANCPIYRKYGEGWKINRQAVKATYYTGVGWMIDANWEGLPRGNALQVAKITNNTIEMDYEVMEARLAITANTAAIAIDDKDVSNSCKIISCEAIQTADPSLSIDMISGHRGRFLKILATGKEGTHCALRDEEDGEHVVPNGKRYIITTMAYKLSSESSTMECPKPTDAEYDQMYGFQAHGHAIETYTPKGLFETLTSIHLPSINTKWIMFGAAAGVAIVTNFSQIGVILSAMICFVAMIQPAAAMSIATEHLIDDTIDIILMANHISPSMAWLALASILMALSIGPKTDAESAKRVASSLWVYMLRSSEMRIDMAILSLVILACMRHKRASDLFGMAAGKAQVEYDKCSARVEPLLQPIKAKLHSVGSSMHITADEGGSSPYIYVQRPAPTSDEQIDTERIQKRALIAAPFTRLPKERRMMAKRRKGVKAMRGFVLYDEEYDALEKQLKQLDEVSIARIYAGAVRILGRHMWELETLVSRVRSIRLQREMAGIIQYEAG